MPYGTILLLVVTTFVIGLLTWGVRRREKPRSQQGGRQPDVDRRARDLFAELRAEYTGQPERPNPFHLAATGELPVPPVVKQPAIPEQAAATPTRRVPRPRRAAVLACTPLAVGAAVVLILGFRNPGASTNTPTVTATPTTTTAPTPAASATTDPDPRPAHRTRAARHTVSAVPTTPQVLAGPAPSNAQPPPVVAPTTAAAPTFTHQVPADAATTQNKPAPAGQVSSEPSSGPLPDSPPVHLPHVDDEGGQQHDGHHASGHSEATGWHARHGAAILLVPHLVQAAYAPPPLLGLIGLNRLGSNTLRLTAGTTSMP